jgi:hypothetical protein
LAYHLGDRLPRARHPPQKGTVTCPGIVGKSGQVQYQAYAEGVEMNISDEFQEIRVLLNQNGLVPILEEMAYSAVPAVEIDRVSCEEATHGGRERPPPCAHQEMDMVGKKRPG